MHINSLSLRNFRNYSELDFAPSQGLNIIIGENAQGKPTHRIHFLCGFGRSHRTTDDSDMVQYKKRCRRIIKGIRQVRQHAEHIRKAISLPA